MWVKCARASRLQSIVWCAAITAACGFPDVSFDVPEDGGRETSLITEGGVATVPSAQGAGGGSSLETQLAVGSPDGSFAADGSTLRDRVDASDAVPDAASPSSGSGGTGGSASSSGGSSSSGSTGGSSGVAGSGGSTGGSGGVAGSSGSTGGSSGVAGSSGSTGGSGTGGSSGGSGSSGSASSSGGSGGNDGGVSSGTCACPSGLSAYPSNVPTCGTITLANLSLACTASGFTGNDPGCGNTGEFLTCTPLLGAAGLVVGCSSSGPAPRVQTCH
jgi:hypothetical protein